MQTIIRVEKLAKTFNQHQALHAVDLNIHHGEMVALLGPPGPRYPQKPRPYRLHIPTIQPGEPPERTGERADWRARQHAVLAHLF
ncbi:phosphonate ABC transporter ATPase [Escherichia coli]|nr:phosphonate ABC transporter ATPase [Escherichia coli]